jgi:COMPASS component SPP1
MKRRIEDWTKRGGKKTALWEDVKAAEKREAVVFTASPLDGMAVDGVVMINQKPFVHAKPSKTSHELETEKLDTILASIADLRERLKNSMEIISWRERVLQLAIEKASDSGYCGWDQRICFGEDEYAEFGNNAIESYENDPDGGWWCLGEEECSRHAG